MAVNNLPGSYHPKLGVLHIDTTQGQLFLVNVDVSSHANHRLGDIEGSNVCWGPTFSEDKESEHAYITTLGHACINIYRLNVNVVTNGKFSYQLKRIFQHVMSTMVLLHRWHPSEQLLAVITNEGLDLFDLVPSSGTVVLRKSVKGKFIGLEWSACGAICCLNAGSRVIFCKWTRFLGRASTDEENKSEIEMCSFVDCITSSKAVTVCPLSIFGNDGRCFFCITYETNMYGLFDLPQDDSPALVDTVKNSNFFTEPVLDISPQSLKHSTVLQKTDNEDIPMLVAPKGVLSIPLSFLLKDTKSFFKTSDSGSDSNYSDENINDHTNEAVLDMSLRPPRIPASFMVNGPPPTIDSLARVSLIEISSKLGISVKCTQILKNIISPNILHYHSSSATLIVGSSSYNGLLTFQLQSSHESFLLNAGAPPISLQKCDRPVACISSRQEGSEGVVLWLKQIDEHASNMPFLPVISAKREYEPLPKFQFHCLRKVAPVELLPVEKDSGENGMPLFRRLETMLVLKMEKIEEILERKLSELEKRFDQRQSKMEQILNEWTLQHNRRRD